LPAAATAVGLVLAAVAHLVLQAASVLAHPSTQLSKSLQPAVESQLEDCEGHLGAAHERHAERSSPESDDGVESPPPPQ
jgi:hypothetical protein